MTAYLILLPGEESGWEAAAAAEERERVYGVHREFMARLEKRGHRMTGGAELRHSSEAVVLRTGADGEQTLTQGPNAESVEQGPASPSWSPTTSTTCSTCCASRAAGRARSRSGTAWRAHREAAADRARPRRSLGRGRRLSDESHPDDAVQGALGAALREEWGRLLALLATRFHRLDLAEDGLADAFEAAARTWPGDGVPTNPAAWLLTAARRRVLDRLRSEEVANRRLPELAVESGLTQQAPGVARRPVDGARLIWTS